MSGATRVYVAPRVSSMHTRDYPVCEQLQTFVIFWATGKSVACTRRRARRRERPRTNARRHHLASARMLAAAASAFEPLPVLQPLLPGDALALSVDLGLPRSGTSSLAIAAALLGMRVSHVWCSASGPDRSSLFDAGCDCRSSRYFIRCAHRRVFDPRDYDHVADVPYFMIARDTYTRRIPGARFVCTMRSKREWVQSVINHGSAGGLQMFLHAKSMLNISTGWPYRKRNQLTHHTNGYRGRNGLWQHSAEDFLGAYYDWHRAHTCDTASEIIWLNSSDAAKWATFCHAVPPRFRKRCAEVRRRRMCWPHMNPHGAVEGAASNRSTTRNVLETEVSSQHRHRAADSDSALSCVPWSSTACRAHGANQNTSLLRKLPRSRVDTGRVEGQVSSGLTVAIECSTGHESCQPSALPSASEQSRRHEVTGLGAEGYDECSRAAP